jgi:HEAT repeat protein
MSFSDDTSPRPRTVELTIAALVMGAFAAAWFLGVFSPARAPTTPPPGVKNPPTKPAPPRPEEYKLADIIEDLRAGPDQPERWFKALAGVKRLGPKARDAAPLLAEQYCRYWSYSSSANNLADALHAVGPDAAPALLRESLKRVRRGDYDFSVEVGKLFARIGPEALPCVVAALGAEDVVPGDDERQRLAHFWPLLRPSGAKAVPALADGLKLPGALARRRCAELLSDYGAQAAPAVPALRAALADADAGVRARAACALGNVGPKAAAALPGLRAALDDPDPTVRVAAGYALGGRVADEADLIAPVLLAVGSEIETLPPYGWEAPRFFGESAARWWAAEMRRRRWVTCHALLLLCDSGRGESAVPLLLRLLKAGGGNPGDDRWVALILLGRVGSREEEVWSEVAALAAADPSGEYAWRTLRALAPQHPDWAAAFFRRGMKSADPRLRWAAFGALAARDPAAARDALPAAVRAVVGDAPVAPRPAPRPFTRDADYFYRRVGDDVEYDSPFPLPPASDPRLDWTVLQKLTPDDGEVLPFLLDAWKAGVQEVVPALGRLGPAAKPAIPELILHLDQEQATAVDEILAGLGDDAAATAARAVRDEKHPRRRACVRFLARVAPKHPATAEALKRTVADKDAGLRSWTVRNVAEMPADAAAVAVPILTAAVNDVEDYVRQGAVAALGKYGPDAKEAVPGLARLLAAGDPTTRQMACEVLGRIGPGAKAAVPALLVLFEDGAPELREAAVRACGRIGRDAVGPLIEALKSGKPAVRAGAARALGQVGAAAKQDALPHLLRLRDYDADEGVRFVAAEAVKRLEVEDRP